MTAQTYEETLKRREWIGNINGNMLIAVIRGEDIEAVEDFASGEVFE